MAERRQDEGGWLPQEDLEKAQEAIRILSAIPLAIMLEPVDLGRGELEQSRQALEGPECKMALRPAPVG